MRIIQMVERYGHVEHFCGKNLNVHYLFEIVLYIKMRVFFYTNRKTTATDYNKVECTQLWCPGFLVARLANLYTRLIMTLGTKSFTHKILLLKGHNISNYSTILPTIWTFQVTSLHYTFPTRQKQNCNKTKNFSYQRSLH